MISPEIGLGDGTLFELFYSVVDVNVNPSGETHPSVIPECSHGNDFFSNKITENAQIFP